MNLSSLYKQLKKRLRQKRRWLSLGFFIVAAAVGLLTLFGSRSSDIPGDAALTAETLAAVRGGQAPQTYVSEEQRQTLEQIRTEGGTREVFVRRSYVCGEENGLAGRMGTEEILSFHQEHPTWKVELDGNGSVTFTEQIDDLSPACKQNAYFGVDKTGNLSLFEGPPDNEKVIRTFFQLNTGYLESSLPHNSLEELKKGIPVIDMAEYNSVLSTFSEFAVEAAENVMIPAQ